MFLPTKYIPEEKTIIYLGGLLLTLFKKSISISELWDKYKDNQKINKLESVSFDCFVYAIDFLYIINALYYKNGHLYKGVNHD